MLRKEPKGRDVLDDDTFAFVDDFKHPKLRVKINQVMMKETVCAAAAGCCLQMHICASGCCMGGFPGARVYMMGAMQVYICSRTWYCRFSSKIRSELI